MKNYLFYLLIFFVSSVMAQNWQPTSSSVSFKIKMLGVNVDGTLKGMKTSLKFANNEPIGLSATIDSKSVNTSNSLRDKHLKEKEDFFQPDLFPLISMSSVSIQKTDGGKYTGIFKVTIKNVSKNLKIPFTFSEKDGKGLLKTDFTLNRQEFKFGGDTPGMGDNVKVSILLNLAKN
jgi:polyisoprenoid-binding protein YceI